MKQWDIFHYPFEEERPHYVVVISSDERCAGSQFVNGLLCVTIRAGRSLDPNFEVALDRADGMDWATAVRCDLFYQIERKLMNPQGGQVSYQRRIQIAKMIRRLMRLDLG